MQIWGITIPAAVTVAGTIYTLFARLDAHQTPAQRRFVAGWLKDFTVETDGWSAVFTQAFNRWYGGRHFSFRCLGRSMLQTLLLYIVTAAIFYDPNAKSTEDMWIIAQHIPVAMTAVLIGNFIGACTLDYFALYKTRLLLAQSDYFSRKIGLAGLACYDVLSTAVILLALALVLWPVGILLTIFDLQLAMAGHIVLPSINLFLHVMLIVFRELWEQLTIGQLMVSVGLPFLTCAWIWAYLVTASFLRLFAYSPSAIRFASKLIDIDNHPAKNLGLITACVSGLVVWLLSFIP